MSKVQLFAAKCPPGSSHPECQFPVLAGSYLSHDDLGSPALAFVRTACHLLGLDAAVTDDVALLRRRLLKLLGVGEFGSAAQFREPCMSFRLPDVICGCAAAGMTPAGGLGAAAAPAAGLRPSAGSDAWPVTAARPLNTPTPAPPRPRARSYCNDCRDLDLCRDPELQAGQRWQCAACAQPYDMAAIEARLVKLLGARIKEYVLQDLQCHKCKQVRRMGAHAGRMRAHGGGAGRADAMHTRRGQRADGAAPPRPPPRRRSRRSTSPAAASSAAARSSTRCAPTWRASGWWCSVTWRRTTSSSCCCSWRTTRSSARTEAAAAARGRRRALPSPRCAPRPRPCAFRRTPP
jgi:hypothetical protein